MSYIYFTYTPSKKSADNLYSRKAALLRGFWPSSFLCILSIRAPPQMTRLRRARSKQWRGSGNLCAVLPQQLWWRERCRCAQWRRRTGPFSSSLKCAPESLRKEKGRKWKQKFKNLGKKHMSFFLFQIREKRNQTKFSVIGMSPLRPRSTQP